MPTATNDGVELYYERAGPTDRDPVVFVGDAGLGAWQWGWQHRAVVDRFGALTWDLRGTGRSDAPDGPYDVETLSADLEAVLSAAGVGRAHLVGSGLGGAVALTYALGYARARTLTLFGTPASGAALADAGVDPAEDTGSTDPGADPGSGPLCADPDDRAALRASLAGLCSADFREAQPDAVEGILDWRAEEDAAPEACRAQVGALAGFDASDRLHEVTEPALVVHGGDDRVVPPDAGRRLARGLPRGTHEVHDGTGHLVFVERSRPVNDRLVGFLEAHAEDRD